MVTSQKPEVVHTHTGTVCCRRLPRSCLTLCDPTDCSPPGSSVHRILQARTLELVAISSSRGSSRPRDQTRIFCIGSRFFTTEPPEKPNETVYKSLTNSIQKPYKQYTKALQTVYKSLTNSIQKPYKQYTALQTVYKSLTNSIQTALQTVYKQPYKQYTKALQTVYKSLTNSIQTALQKEALLPCVATRMSLEGTELSEISHM